jgi:hypothetical protein
MTLYEIVHGVADSRKIVIVPLTNSSRKVKLYQEDYEALERLGVGLPWRWNQEQVWVRNNNRNISVARLIVDADKGEKISFKDGDPANLIRSNLVRIPGSSKYRAREHVALKFSGKPQEVRHVFTTIN